MTILSLFNFVGIWIPAVVSALYVGLMKQLNPEYIVTMNTYISGLRIGFFVMLLNLLVNVATFSNGKRKYGPFDALEFERDPYSHPTKKLSATYPAIPEEMATKQPSGIVIGKRGKRYVCNQLSKSGAHHTIILGESGCGKTSTVVLDTLLCNAETAIFAIDVKGELHQKGAYLGDVNVMIVDPEDRGTYGYDLFYALRENPSDQEVLDTLRDTVLSLIPLRADEKNPFWPRSARSLLLALMLYCYHSGIKNMIDIADEITKDSIRSKVEEVFNESAEDSTEHKLISTFYSLPDETLGSVNGQMQQALELFITDENIRYMLRNNLKIMKPVDLNEGKKVYLSIKEDKLLAYAQLLHLIVNQTLTEMERRPEGSDPVLIIIDELPRILSVGKIAKLENALETLRSRNVTLMLIAQSLEALERAYAKKDIDAMVANCPYKVILSATSISTQDTIRKWAGKYKEYKYTRSGTGSKKSTSVTMEDKDIVEGSDLLTLPKTQEAILITPYGYNRVKKVSYYKDRLIAPIAKRIKRQNEIYVRVQ